MSFPPATEMFQFAGFASILRSIPLARWVAPFGTLRIIGCSPLPEAYRRVPRPSSPLGTKASTKCPYLSLENLPIPMRQHTHVKNTKGIIRSYEHTRSTVPRGQEPGDRSSSSA